MLCLTPRDIIVLFIIYVLADAIAGDWLRGKGTKHAHWISARFRQR